MRKRCHGLLALGAALLLAGCETTRYTPGQPLTGDARIDGREALEHGPARDRVLWQYRMAAAAMRQGQFAEAKPLLDEAIGRISAIYSNVKDKDAKKARSYFHAEGKKTFIGEPYERVMAYYYRGLLYWMDGEPDNARACFRNGQLQDSDTTDKGYAADYVLLDYLDGFASAKLGGDGSDAYRRALALSKSQPPLPPYNTKANVLLFLEFGPGPTKYATGEYAQELRFRRHDAPMHNARVIAGQQTAWVPPYDDLFYQATTRGGRVMDHILANKAVFKSTTDTLGTAALISGAILASDHNTQTAGLAVMGVGLLSKIIASASNPEADTRAWDNLPNFLSFVALELPPGQHTLTVEFLNEAGQVVANLTKTVTLNVPVGSGDKVVYVSDRSLTPQTL